MLVFIGVQSLLTTLNARQLARARLGGAAAAAADGGAGRWRDRRVASGPRSSWWSSCGAQVLGAAGRPANAAGAA